MRLATFNILHGRTIGDGVDPQRLMDCVRRLDPDVLALQEADCEQPRSDHADLRAAAAEAMGAVEHRFVAAISGTPEATWVAATGREQPGTAAYGIALLSRFPVASWQVVAAVHRWSGMRPLAAAATFPAPAPDRQLDHILTDDGCLRGGAVEAELMPISDHRPLVVKLERA